MSQTINPSGKQIVSVETDFLGRKLTLEVNRVGFRSSASVLARYGDTVVLGTAMVGKPIAGSQRPHITGGGFQRNGYRHHPRRPQRFSGG